MGNDKSDDYVEKPCKHKKRKRRLSSCDSDSDSSPASIDDELKQKLLKKLKKLKKKEKKKRKKKKKKKEKVQEEKNKKDGKKCVKKPVCEEKMIGLEISKKFAPMTKEEWEKQQNTLTRVYDEETGRTRLIRGSGEIVEECVSRERHLAINKQATLTDGEYFQKVLSSKLNQFK